MKKIIKAILGVSVIFAANTQFAFADGNPYAPYNPYAPHNPLPTGFDDTNLFYITALAVFSVAMIALAIAKTIKKKIHTN